MAGQTVDYIVRVRGATDASVDQAVAKLKQFVNAQEDVAVSAEKVSRAQLSAEKSLERWSRSLDMNFRQMREVEKLQNDLTRARESGRNVDAEAARLTALLTEKHQAASRAQKSLADTTKLSRYELINLSRQIQDVGVGLASGQSPFTVLIQQGTQIADVFAASQTTVRQFFTQALGWAGRFAMSTAGVVTGIAAIGTGALFAAGSWASGQRDITRALSGIGAASGITRDEINKLGEDTSRTTAASANEAREAATTFAATGKIYGDNIKAATELTMDFARATGTDMSTAAKTLAEALADPAKGAQELNKQIGFLDARTLEYIQTLLAQNKTQEAQAVLLNSMRSQTQQQAQNIGFLEKAWQAATKAVSEYFDAAAARPAARTVERLIPGADLGGFTDQEKLDRARARRAEVAASPFQGRLAQKGVIDFAVNELLKLEAAATNAAKAADDRRFDNLTLQAKEATEALVPEIEGLRQLETQLNKIKDAREAEQRRSVDPITGGAVDRPGRANLQFEQAAVDIGTVRTQQLKDQADQHGRAAARLLEQAQLYPGISLEGVKQLEALKQQLPIAQALTASQRLGAEQQARVEQLLDAGRRPAEALRMASEERTVKEAQIASEMQKNITALERQLPVSRAITAEQQMQAQEQMRIAQLADETGNAELAARTAGLERANAQAQLSAGLERSLAALKDQEAVAGAVTAQERLQAEERARFNELARQTNDIEGSRKVAAQERRNAEAAIEAGAQRNLDTLRDQEAVAGAVTGAEKLAAQEQAEFNRLLREGVSEQKAMATAAQQTANAIAGANANAQQQLTSLQQQNQLINAGSEEERARIQSAQTYVNLLNQGVDAMLAQQVAAQQLRNSLDQMAAAQERAAQAAEDQRQANQQSARFIGGSGFAGTRTSGTLGGHQRIENIIKQAEKRGAEVVPLFDFPIGTGVQPFFERETDTSIKNLINDVLRGRGGLTEAINLVKSLPAQNLEDELRNQTLMTLAQHLTEQTGSPAQEISLIQEEISRIRQQPGSLENLAALKALNDRLKQLTESTDALNDTMQIGLDPIYTQGHQALKIGYFDERGGGFRTGTGWVSPSTASQQSLPAAMPGPTTSAGMGSSNFTDSPFGRIFHFAAGGMTAWGKNWDQYRSSYRGPSSGPTVTNTPTLFTTSENYQPELIVPIRTLGNMVSGNSGGNTVANDNSRTTVVNVNVGGGSSMGDRRIRRHIAQGVGRAVAGAM